MPGRRAAIEVDEVNVEMVVEALSREIRRLKALADEARDRADRETWAIYEVKRSALHWAWSRADQVRRELGELSPEVQEDVAARVARTRHRMPRSAANAEILKREREGPRRQRESTLSGTSSRSGAREGQGKIGLRQGRNPSRGG